MAFCSGQAVLHSVPIGISLDLVGGWTSGREVRILIFMSTVAPDSLANEQAIATWSNRACGTRNADENAAAGSLAFFNRMAKRRYGRDDPWIPAVLDFASMAGKQVLEIGHGMGCDLVHAAKAGATVHGVDITPNHHEIAKKHFAVNGLQADLHLCDASQLPFASNSFDIVFSIGVLHHTNDTIRCISEAYRVLKPRGTFIMALYHFWSLPHLYLLSHGILHGNLRKLGYRNLLSTIEGGADGITIKPLVKLYSRRVVRTILADFSETTTQTCGLAYDRIPLVGRFMPSVVGKGLERRWGWYLVSRSTK
jgi:ubiquinone/menaquinone biosynthesis C-methylase UbiE